MAYEKSVFVWIALVKSNSSLAWGAKNCFNTYSLFAPVKALIWAVPVFSSNKTFFSSHSPVLIGGPVHKAERKWKAKRWRIAFGREGDDEYFFSGMMWADNYRIFSDDKEKLTCMVDDIIEDLLDLDIEPKLESLWWMGTNKEEDKSTLKMVSREKSWNMPFVVALDLLGCRFRRTGKAVQGTEKTLRKGMGCWWQDGTHLSREERVSEQDIRKRTLTSTSNRLQACLPSQAGQEYGMWDPSLLCFLNCSFHTPSQHKGCASPSFFCLTEPTFS